MPSSIFPSRRELRSGRAIAGEPKSNSKTVVPCASAPIAQVEFTTLGLSDAGNRISQVSLSEGLAYVNWLGKSSDEFSLAFSHERISLDHAAHFRVDASPQIANLAVFKGDLAVDGPSGKVTVEKKKTATFDASQDDKYTVANNVYGIPARFVG